MTDTAAPTDSEAKLVDDAIDAFLADHDPASMSTEEFRGARYDHGLAWVSYPEGFGGLAVRPALQRTVEARLREAGGPPQDATLFFQQLAGPTIVTHATDEMKHRLLRPMFTGEERWCQLFSEPGAGSDFAGLATRAVRDGDEWVVNGQKVWNTIAHMADRGMLVARTDPDVPKHRGLTYFALDMHAPGVEVRPLRQITGEAEFNEVYLTDVRIPDTDRIGDEGDGWRVAMTTLMNERTAIGAGSGGGPPKRGSGTIADLVATWKDLPAGDRTADRLDRLMSLWARAEVLRLTNMRSAGARRAGNPGPDGSISKLAFAELNQAIYEMCIDLMGPDGLTGYDFKFRRADGLEGGSGWGDVRKAFLRVRANSIEGGTSEIMRNILGERVLGLPGEPRIDKDLPWSDVPRS